MSSSSSDERSRRGSEGDREDRPYLPPIGSILGYDPPRPTHGPSSAYLYSSGATPSGAGSTRASSSYLGPTTAGHANPYGTALPPYSSPVSSRSQIPGVPVPSHQAQYPYGSPPSPMPYPPYASQPSLHHGSPSATVPAANSRSAPSSSQRPYPNTPYPYEPGRSYQHVSQLQDPAQQQYPAESSRSAGHSRRSYDDYGAPSSSRRGEQPPVVGTIAGLTSSNYQATSLASAGLTPSAAQAASDELRRYECHLCEKRFSRPSSLNTHMNTHTGEQPFQCPIPGCGKKFNVSSNMRRHMRNHEEYAIQGQPSYQGGGDHSFQGDDEE